MKRKYDDYGMPINELNIERDGISDYEVVMGCGLDEEKPLRSSVKDGWHTVLGHEVYTTDGMVMRGVVGDNRLNCRTTNPYCDTKHGWSNVSGHITLAALRAGMKRGTIKMM